MIDFSQVSIQSLVIHHIGCKAAGEPVRFSKSTYNLANDEAVSDVLIQYFFKPFKSEVYYNFTSPSEIPSENPLFQVVEGIFSNEFPFFDSSVQLAEKLYLNSNHPNIRGGEFYMAQFSNCVVDGEIVDGLGIFKSENKDTFLKVFMKDNSFEIGTQQGINIKKLDKGCLIFNTERELGFKICSIDNLNKGAEARFWVDDFLGLKPREDNYYFTNNYLKLCRGFVADIYNKDNHVDRTDQIDLLQRSLDYFSKKDSFNENEFAEKVIQNQDVAEEFNRYKEFFESENVVPLKSEFEISKSAIKDEKKFFKSILKLDKNFHIYVHGNHKYIERDYDQDRKMNFYKLYFEQEN